MDKATFDTDPRDYALSLIDNGIVDARQLALCAVLYLSHDDVRDMLDCNELSPRFGEEE